MHRQVREIRNQIDDLVQFLGQISVREPAEFDAEFHARLNQIEAATARRPQDRESLMQYCFAQCAGQLDRSPVHRHCRSKPFGYAGDFLATDMLYKGEISGYESGKHWDEFANRQPGPIAIRNRMAYFGQTLETLLARLGRPVSILNLASGPCRDVERALQRVGEKAHGSRIHCVDIDNRAISYARQTVAPFKSQIEFEWQQGNVLLIHPPQQYDLVWSAGLIDYLPERMAVLLIRKMWKWVKPGGTVVFGNLHPRNPSRQYIEWCIDWYLIYRTERDMKRLCELAGLPQNGLVIEQDPLGIVVFCRMQKPHSVTGNTPARRLRQHPMVTGRHTQVAV